MSAILLMVFLSGILNNPADLIGEKDYIRAVEHHVNLASEMVEIEIREDEFNQMILGVEFMLGESFGKKSDYIVDFVKEEMENLNMSKKDYDVIDFSIDCKKIVLEKHLDYVVLKYERSYG